MDELVAKLQRKFEADLEHFLPDRKTPYFDRKLLVERLLCAAHIYGLEICQKIMEGYHKLESPIVLTEVAVDRHDCLPDDPACPKCGARLNG